MQCQKSQKGVKYGGAKISKRCKKHRNEYESYIFIDFNKAPEMVRDWFDLYLEDLDTLFLYLSQHYKVRLYERKRKEVPAVCPETGCEISRLG